jgi:hypothetical protein
MLDLSILQRGGVCVVDNWLPATLLTALRDDLYRLDTQGAFVPSGLTPRLAPSGGFSFGESDRKVCVLTNTKDVGGEQEARSSVATLLDSLRLDLQRTLGRKLTLTEQYYSLSLTGSSLPLHLDEHHPATKHTPPEDAATRRSVSFLVYLSEDVSGGALRAFHRAHSAVTSCHCGAHQQDLQIGWLEWQRRCHPVFLDAWVPPSWMRRQSPMERLAVWRDQLKDEDEAEVRFYADMQPSSRLYIVDTSSDQRVDVTDTIAADDPEFGGADVESHEFIQRLRGRLLCPHQPADLSGVADCEHPRMRSVDIPADGGTLVLFDSTTVPHSVLPVAAGQRLAMGGWFHETVQEYPRWYEEAFEVS